MISEINFNEYVNKFINDVYLDYNEKEKIIKVLNEYKKNIIKFLNLNDIIYNKIKNNDYSHRLKSFSYFSFYNKVFLNDFVAYIIGIFNEKYIINGLSYYTNSNSNYENINYIIDKEGYYINEIKINTSICDNILNKINKNFKFKNKLNKKIESNFDIYNSQNKGTFWILDDADIITLEEVQKIVTDPHILNIAQNYLRCRPILLQTHFWASYPSTVKDSTYEFHQDGDDVKFLKVFIYLNDVNSKNGPHNYVKGSKLNQKTISKDYKLSDRVDDKTIIKLYGKENIISITGEKGNILFEDTKGFHKGTELQEGMRFMLQLQYCATSTPLGSYIKFINNLDKNNNKILYDSKQKYPDIFALYNFKE